MAILAPFKLRNLRLISKHINFGYQGGLKGITELLKMARASSKCDQYVYFLTVAHTASLCDEGNNGFKDVPSANLFLLFDIAMAIPFKFL